VTAGVAQVRLYKAHPEGVVTVKFRQEDAAKKCLEKNTGRFFAGREIEAALWDGLANYAEVSSSAAVSCCKGSEGVEGTA
jgi:HIV Tat-specific factor 1